MQMNFTNTALVQEEVLLDIANVLDYGWPAGPAFIHALGTLTEALVIHNVVYFDPLGFTQRDDNYFGELHSALIDSKFVQQLVSSKALVPFPRGGQSADIVIDITCEGISFAWANPDDEQKRYESLSNHLARIPQIFSTMNFPTHPNDYMGGVPNRVGFDADDINTLVASNLRARGYLNLAKSLGTSLYPSYAALPHQIGAVKVSNSKARELYETVISEVTSLDEQPVGDDEVTRVPIPPLLQIALSNCKDSSAALPAEIYKLRHHHRQFRKYLTEYEQSWNSARTRQDRLKLRNEFQNAWQSLVTKTERPSTRIIYTLWDILKDPLSAPITIGDKLAEVGRELFIVGRVKGLYDFWRELAHSPIPERNKELMSRVLRNLAVEDVWRSARHLAESTNSYLAQSTMKS